MIVITLFWVFFFLKLFACQCDYKPLTTADCQLHKMDRCQRLVDIFEIAVEHVCQHNKMTSENTTTTTLFFFLGT